MELIEELARERFGADAARELCRRPGLFEQGRLYRRYEISKTLRDEFVGSGGREGTTKDDVARVLKKWLLGRDSPFEKEMRGRYRFVRADGSGGQAAGSADAYRDGADVAEGAYPVPGRELGEGPYEVYAWCLPLYEEAAGGRWPIKIGMAGPGGLGRRFRDFHENLPEPPSYLLRLGCADAREARDREFLLHAWFRSRGQKLDGVPGEEWFLTNPHEIEQAVRNIIDTNGPSEGAAAHEIEDAIAVAFTDVTVEDWDRLPDDLSDRLDDYLYGNRDQ